MCAHTHTHTHTPHKSSSVLTYQGHLYMIIPLNTIEYFGKGMWKVFEAFKTEVPYDSFVILSQLKQRIFINEEAELFLQLFIYCKLRERCKQLMIMVFYELKTNHLAKDRLKIILAFNTINLFGSSVLNLISTNQSTLLHKY